MHMSLLQIVHLFNSIQFNSIHFISLHFTSIQFNSIQFNSIQFNSIQFNSIQFNSIYSLHEWDCNENDLPKVVIGLPDFIFLKGARRPIFLNLVLCLI